MYVYTYTSQYRDAEWEKEIKENLDSNECRVPREPFQVPFWYLCRNFVSPVLECAVNIRAP